MRKVILENIQKQIELKRASPTFVDDHDLKRVAEWIKQAKKILVLTGAGISTMSGIPDYRGGTEALYQRNPRVMEHLNQTTFRNDPGLFWDGFYDLVALTLASLIPKESAEAVLTAFELIQPNEGHRFFSSLEKAGKEITIITQNVDGLHQKAGSRSVLDIHGSITTCSCSKCERSYELKEVLEAGIIPMCNCGTILCPDVVFFGDIVRGLGAAVNAVEESDLIIVAGTSLHVSPFNHLPTLATEHAKLVYLNANATEEGSNFDIFLKGNISEISRLLEIELGISNAVPDTDML